ncbi:MAG: ornithine cyclodeaminase, partial [Acidobacteriota bacterium]
MNSLPFLDAATVEPHLSWRRVVDALDAGHRRPRASIGDVLLRRDARSMLNRAAWVDGLGLGLKTMTIFPENPPPVPPIQGVFVLFDDHDGAPIALVDGILLTKWKTASDSLLGARYLARPDSRTLLIVGAGTVAASLIEAYTECFPSLERIVLWNRTASKARSLADAASTRGPVTVATDLPSAVADADIVATATMASAPVLHGDWVRPGTHVDLIGAYLTRSFAVSFEDIGRVLDPLPDHILFGLSI